MIAPCAGAGSIQSNSTALKGFKPILSRPAAAKIAPFHLLEASFLTGYLHFPEGFSML
jgi:hypothetical protein